MSRLHVLVPLRWADLDAYGHVNNVAVMRLLEEARIEAFWRHPDPGTGDDPGAPDAAVLDGGPGARTQTVVARHEVEYVLPLEYRREPVTIETWLGRLGGASIEVCYQVTTGSGESRTVHANAATTLVLIDTATGRPRRLTDDERATWSRYVEPSVQMRRR